jgi:hypothetical protein
MAESSGVGRRQKQGQLMAKAIGYSFVSGMLLRLLANTFLDEATQRSDEMQILLHKGPYGLGMLSALLILVFMKRLGTHINADPTTGLTKPAYALLALLAGLTFFFFGVLVSDSLFMLVRINR